MNSDEVVVHEVQGHSTLEVMEFFRESVGFAGQSSHVHSDGQVSPFDMGRADERTQGISLHGRDLAVHVAFLRLTALPESKSLDQHSIVYFAAKRVPDGLRIGL